MGAARDLGAKWADKLASHGVRCIPMDPINKRPMVHTSSWWGGFPVSAMRELQPQNISALCGQVSRLIVIDLDGPDELLRSYWRGKPALPLTWQVRTSSGGRHLWYRIPDWHKQPMPRCKLWQGQGKHEEIAILGERSLATCPPSQYGSGQQYKWLAGKNPLTSPMATLPAWLLNEIIAVTHRSAPAPETPEIGVIEQPQGMTFPVGESRIDPLPIDRLAVLRSHGLKLASSRPNPSGWIACYRPHDNDRVPSASVKYDGSVLWTSSNGAMGFWDALCLLGNYPDRQSAYQAINNRG